MSPESGWRSLIREQWSVINIKLHILFWNSPFHFCFFLVWNIFLSILSYWHVCLFVCFLTTELEFPVMEDLTGGMKRIRVVALGPMFWLAILINDSWIRVHLPSATDYELGARLGKLSAKSILLTFLLSTKCQESFQVRAITVKENRT